MDSSESTIDEIETPSPRFTFVSYSVKDSVEYDVVMTTSSSFNGRNISTSYNFKTRYSKLLKLHETLEEKPFSFPQKKIFGSKSATFIKKRMIELQYYLN